LTISMRIRVRPRGMRIRTRPSAVEQKQVTPKQHPTKNGNWVPGDAPSQVLRWATKAVAKAGTIGIIGVYPMEARSFPLGVAMNRNLSINFGNCNHRSYVPKLVEMVRVGVIDPVENPDQASDPDRRDRSLRAVRQAHARLGQDRTQSGGMT